jgi:Hemerythrin HHE cation binding domain
MPDVFEVLGTAHRETEQMLDRMQAMMATPAELRQEGGSLADKLISAASQHEAAEEQYFWPAVKEKIISNGNALAAGGIEQETEAKKVLAELDGMASDDPQFIPLMTQFAHAARAHIAYEEQQVWPGLKAVLTAEEADALGAKLASGTQAGPTRPHPHAPPSPAVLKAAGPAVAAADKLRDYLSGRDN